MTKYLIQLYGNIDDLSNTRILDELDFYMFEVKQVSEMIFFYVKEQTIYLVVSDDTQWNLEKLLVLCRTALRDNTFVIVKMDNYNGYTSFWEILNEKSKELFKDSKTFRLNAGRGSKLSKLLSRIKRAVKTKEKQS
jgi:GTPase Era involved in 16S rRNA processing